MTNGLPRVLGQLHHVGPGLTDGQLLARFVATRDEASFAALLRRHGSMVLAVCRRVLRNSHDVEDAFQATFLVLARKAGSVVRRESVASFLYGVAYRTALDAATACARRRARERQVKDMPHPVATPAEAAAETPDWRPLLDRELNRLSEKYRAAVVLCDLEGHSRQEAARQLGVPLGTVSSRLTEARKLLAKRLKARGVVLSGGALAVVLSANAVSAQVSVALLESTARAAALAAAGQFTAASASAVVLMNGVMKAMFLSKLRLAVGIVMVIAALGGVGFASWSGAAARAEDAHKLAARDGAKPLSELGALHKENELPRINNNVLLEEIGSLQNENRTLPAQESKAIQIVCTGFTISFEPSPAEELEELEEAMQSLRDAKAAESKRRAAEEKATKKLRELLDKYK